MAQAVVDAVVIGRNEGARLLACLASLSGQVRRVVYVDSGSTDSSIIEFLKEMRRMSTEKVDNEELQVVKNVIAGQFSQNLEEPGTVANFALTTARYKLPADYYEKYLEVLQAVTPEEVQAMAKKYINADRAHILVVGNRDDVADRLKQFAAVGFEHVCLRLWL